MSYRRLNVAFTSLQRTDQHDHQSSHYPFPRPGLRDRTTHLKLPPISFHWYLGLTPLMLRRALRRESTMRSHRTTSLCGCTERVRWAVRTYQLGSEGEEGIIASAERAGL